MTAMTLNYREYNALETLVAPPQNASHLRRAQALLWLDAGDRAPAVAARLRVSRRPIDNWGKRFQARRGMALMARLADGPRCGRPRTAAGVIDPLIRAIIAQAPRALGCRSTVWTAPLLTQDLAQRHHICVSRPSVGLAMARLNLRWKRPRHDRARRPAAWRQAKGGANVVWQRGSGRSS
jgi:transposase